MKYIMILAWMLITVSLHASTISSLYTYTTDKKGNPAMVATGCDGTSLSRVNGAKKPSFACSTGYSVTSFQKTKVFATGLESVEFTITVKPGYTASFSSITGDFRRSNSGSMSIRFAYSTENGKWIDAGVDGNPKNGSCGQTNSIAWDFKDFTSNATVTFRIYGFNASSSSGVLQLLNINVMGSSAMVDADGDGYAVGSDCNDNNAAIHPFAVELCNNTDDNCDGSVDEGLFHTYYLDGDQDGYGNVMITATVCTSIPTGYVTNSTDCNDNNKAINPESSEQCNGIDDDCDSGVDEGLQLFTYYPDNNGDGYIDPGESIPLFTCITPIPPGYSVTPIPKVNFTGTTTSFKINPYLFEGMAEQICVGGKGATMDIGSGLYFLHADSLGLNGYTYGGASPSWHYHLAMKRGLKDGNGWNCDLYNKPGTKCDPSVIQGMCCSTYDFDFFNKCAFDFTNKLKSKPSLDFIANPMTADVWEVDTAIVRGRSTFLYVSLENCLSGDLPNQTYPKGGADYVALNNPRIDVLKAKYPNLIIIGDAGSVIKNSFKKWNDDIRMLHADAYRQYLSDSDVYKYPKNYSSFSQLKDTVLRAINFKLPSIMDAFSLEFHDAKCSPAHTGADNRLQMVDYNSMLKQLWIAGYKLWELQYDYDHNGFFCNSLIQSVKALNMEDAVVKNDYRTNQLISDLYHGSKSFVNINIGLDPDKVKAVCGVEGGVYTIVITNFTDNQYTEPGILLDGYFYTSPATSKVIFADRLEDTSLKIQSVSGIILKPNSISKFTFSTVVN